MSISRKGYCCDCDNNPEEPIPQAAKELDNKCHGCWFTCEKKNWKAIGGTVYFDEDGMMLSSDGSRSIFDDVDQ